VREEKDKDKVMERIGEKREIFDYIHYLPFDESVYRNEPDVAPLLEKNTPYVKAVRELYETLVAVRE
jgi:hypothetical protein